MNTVRILMIVASFAASASTQETHSCQSSLSIADLTGAMGPEVAAQRVFANGGFKGWRLYNIQNSAQLMAQGSTRAR
jgi:hypothetical protein